MREKYETPQNLEAEDKAKTLLEGRLNFVLKKVPISYHVDFFAYRDGAFVGPVEYKRRDMTWGEYPTIMVSFLKVQAIKQICMTTQNLDKFLFVIEANNGVYICTSFADARLTYGGRTKATRDSADVEPIYEIPIASFKRLA